MRSGEGKLPRQFSPSVKRDSTAFRVQAKRTRLQPAAVVIDKEKKPAKKQGREREKGDGHGTYP